VTIRDLLRVLAHSWSIVAVLVLLGVAGGATGTLLTAPTYRAEARLYVATTFADSPSDLFQGATYVQIAVKNYAQLATTPFVLSPAIRDLGLHTTPEKLASRIHVTVPEDTTLVSVQVEADSAAAAVRTTNMVARSLQTVATSLTPGQTSNVPSVKITLVEAADTTASRATATTALAVAVGAIGGLVLAVAIALIREALRTRLSTVRDVETVTAAPVLATIRLDERPRRESTLSTASLRAALESDYRALAARILFLRNDDGLRVFSVVAPRAKMGTSSLVLHTARALVGAGLRVIVVDGARGPRGISEALGLHETSGLLEAMNGAGPLREMVKRVEPEGLFVLPQGSAQTRGLMNEDAFGSVLEQLATLADLVLVDTPAVLDDADSAVIVRRTASTLLVAHLGRLQAADLRSALLQLGQLRVVVSGVVALGVQERYRVSVREVAARANTV
jgi:succinoglycan biosynthesis transport protein ExoP